jgi:hypothetical protein
MWHVTSYDDVKRGRVTDVYFQRALETLRGEGRLLGNRRASTTNRYVHLTKQH